MYQPFIILFRHPSLFPWVSDSKSKASKKCGSEGGLVDFTKVNTQTHTLPRPDVGRSSDEKNVWICEMVWMCIEIILEIYKYTGWTKQTPGTCKRARLLEKVVWKSLIQLSCSPINLHLMRLCLAGYMERTCIHAGASGEKMYFIQSGRLNYASILNCKMLRFCFLCTVCNSGFIQQTDSSERSLEITGGSQHPHPGKIQLERII